MALETEVNAKRLSALRRRMGLTLAELGEVFCSSANTMYKLEAGIRPLGGFRLMLLDVIETALKSRSIEQVWGPRVPVPAVVNPAAVPKPRPITPRQRLAQIFAAAHPEVLR